jgi:hypothetical protein
VYAVRYSLPAEAKALDQPLTVAELLSGEATCPICHRIVDRNRYALRTHFRPHVRAGLLQYGQVDELLSFLITHDEDSQQRGACAFSGGGVSV